MYRLIKANFLKQKRKFSLKLLFVAPLISMFLSILLMGGMFFIENSFNWWYTLILPSSIFMIVCFNTSDERKKNRHGLFSVYADKRKLWLSAILSNTISLFVLNFIFFIFITIFTWFFGFELRVGVNLFATFLLTITFSWQIPLFMFISEKIGAFMGVFTGLILNMIFGIFFAPTKLWFVPFAIPSRLMCPVVGVMPNGLPVEIGSNLADSSVVLVGVLIAIVLYFITTILTTLWYNKLEA